MDVPDMIVNWWLKIFGWVPSWMLPAIPAPGPGKIPCYILSGQSNAAGAPESSGLTPKQAAITSGWGIFADGTAVDPAKKHVWCMGVEPGFGADATKFGPEVGFAQVMKPAFNTGLIIKFTAPGMGLEQYFLSPSGGGAKEGYVRLLRTIRDAFNPANAYLAGVIWMQGETDATALNTANDYAKNLMCLISDLRRDTKYPSLRFVIGKIHTSPYWPFAYIVRATQDSVAKVCANVKDFETEDLALGADNAHFNAQSEYILGVRFAEAMLA